MEKKKRVVFSDEEKLRLAELIEVHKMTIENKKSDSASLLEKNKAWEDITQRMNCVGRGNGHPLRTTVQLKKLWENTKYKGKVQAAVGVREEGRDEEISMNYDMPGYEQAVDSVGFQDMTEAMDHRLNIYQVPDVKSEVRTWEVEQSDRAAAHESEPEPEYDSQNGKCRREHESLYNLKLKEAQMRIALLEKQMQHDEELFQLRKRKLLLEILRLEKEAVK